MKCLLTLSFAVILAAQVPAADGALRWFTDLAPFAGRERHVGQDGPLTVADGVVFSGGWDGILRALSTETGVVIWEYDTIREFDTDRREERDGWQRPSGVCAGQRRGRRVVLRRVGCPIDRRLRYHPDSCSSGGNQ